MSLDLETVPAAVSDASPVQGDLLEAASSPVSYTHLDVYKRQDQCQTEGIVRTVTYAVAGDDFGQPVHVGDTYSDEAAREVIRRLTFDTGFYSRCWEISSAHITEDAGRYLAELADIATPTRFLFVAFRIPYSPAIGVKLIATPWTDENLGHVEGITAEDLRREHLKKAMPESLVNVLHLAAQADVRILILDADAQILEAVSYTHLDVYKRQAF